MITRVLIDQSLIANYFFIMIVHKSRLLAGHHNPLTKVPITCDDIIKTHKHVSPIKHQPYNARSQAQRMKELVGTQVVDGTCASLSMPIQSMLGFSSLVVITKFECTAQHYN